MRVFRHTRALSLALLAWATSHCSEPDLTHEGWAELATDPSGCRSFVAAGRVLWGQVPGELACRFDASSRRHSCRISAGSSSSSTSADYASTADFIEAGHHLGKQTSLRETRTENGTVRRTTHHYDELGRLARSREERAGGNVVQSYFDYDSVGRPRRAVTRAESMGDAGCGVERVSIEYSDRERTVLRRFQPADAARCGFTQRSRLERYDARGDRVSVDEADGTGVATLFEAQRGTKTQQVCL